MKIETVAKINLKGEYEVLYMGADRGEARRVYKDYICKKEEYLALFQQSGYASRSMSKGGHISHHASKSPVAEEEKPTRRRRKASEE